VTCEEFQQRVAELTLSLGEPAELSELEAHLREPGPHSGCAEALARARAAAQSPGLALDPIRPSAASWSRLDAQVRPPAAASAWTTYLAWGVAAVAMLLAVLWWTGSQGAERELGESRRQAEQLRAQLTQAQDDAAEKGRQLRTASDQCQRSTEALRQELLLDGAAVALLQASGTRVLLFAPQPAHPGLRAAAVYNPEQHRAMVLSSALPADEKHDYELWVLRGQAAPRPAGLLHISSRGVTLGEVDPGALAGAPPDAFAISIEPRGGAAQPTEVALVAAAHS
jgi:hypothetical protein